MGQSKRPITLSLGRNAVVKRIVSPVCIHAGRTPTSPFVAMRPSEVSLVLAARAQTRALGEVVDDEVRIVLGAEEDPMLRVLAVRLPSCGEERLAFRAMSLVFGRAIRDA